MKTLTLLFALTVGLLSNANAAQVYTNAFVSISRIGTYSKFHLDSTYQGLVRVFFPAPVTWTSGSCDTSSVFIKKDDPTLFAAVQTAMATGQPVQVFSDDTISMISGICILTYLQY